MVVQNLSAAGGSEIACPDPASEGKRAFSNDCHACVELVVWHELLEIDVTAFAAHQQVHGKAVFQPGRSRAQKIDQSAFTLGFLEFPCGDRIQNCAGWLVSSAESTLGQCTRLSRRPHQAHVPRAGPAPQLEHLREPSFGDPFERRAQVKEHIGRYDRRTRSFKELLLGDFIVEVPSGCTIWKNRQTHLFRSVEHVPAHEHVCRQPMGDMPQKRRCTPQALHDVCRISIHHEVWNAPVPTVLKPAIGETAGTMVNGNGEHGGRGGGISVFRWPVVRYFTVSVFRWGSGSLVRS